MLQLAGALHARGLAVTVLHTAFNAPDPARHPGLAFVDVPDAIPETVAAATNGIAKILALNAAMEASGCVRSTLASLMAASAAEGEPRLACLVLDSTSPLPRRPPLPSACPRSCSKPAAPPRLFRSYDMLHRKGYLPSTGWYQDPLCFFLQNFRMNFP